jgi:hypothetical protein
MRLTFETCVVLYRNDSDWYGRAWYLELTSSAGYI